MMFKGKVVSKSINRLGQITSTIAVLTDKDELPLGYDMKTFEVPRNFELGQIVSVTIDSGTEKGF